MEERFAVQRVEYKLAFEPNAVRWLVVDTATGEIVDTLREYSLALASAADMNARACVECAKGVIVSHSGSKLCRSGSIASGGKRAHCTCDACF